MNSYAGWEITHTNFINLTLIILDFHFGFEVMTIPSFGLGYPNYGWNYPITVILILAGIIKLWFSNFGWNLLIMDGDILITHGLEFSLSNYGYENYSVLQQ
jgi:hypothetical protein